MIINLYNPNEVISTAEYSHYFRLLGRSGIMLGDFNAHHPMWNDRRPSDPNGKNLVESLIELDFVTLLTPQNLPTYYHHATRKFSTLDLIFVTLDLYTMSHVQLGEDMGSDHDPVWAEVSFTPQYSPAKRRRKWIFESGSWEAWKKSLPPFIINDCDGITETVNQFQTNLLDTSKRIFKLTREQPNVHYSKPWWNDKCAEAVKQKHKARNYFRRHPTEINYNNFKAKEAIANKCVKDAKTESFRQYISEINSQTPIKSVWDKISALSGKFKPYKPVVLFNANEPITVPLEKTSLIADHYADRFKCSMQKANLKYLLPLSMALVEDLSFSYNENFNMTELDIAIKSLKPTSPGHDLIHNLMIKNLPIDYKTTLLHIFNLSFQNSVIPEDWKISIIIPLLKSGKSSTTAQSYRPISLLPCIGKLLEKLVNNRLMFELESKFVLRPSQGGFRKRLCCIDQVSKLESDIRLALSEKKILVAVFIDLEKAFDSVWHLGLVYKLSRLGIKGKMLAWIKEYLQGRKYKVFFEGEYSSEKPIYSGVPQGAILSPLLFNVMMCDLPLENGVSSTEYADDIAFSFASSDPLEVQEKMNKQMDIFYKWCREWGLSINITKTKAMYFTNRRLVPPDIELSNVPLEYVPTYRYLGLLLDSPKLTWKNHIEFLKDSSAQRVNILKSVSAHHWGADRKMLLNLYFSLIRSRFDYGCQVYINSAFTNLSKLDKIQNNCLRIALGVPKTSPIS